MKNHPPPPPVATKSRLERELAEAVQEEENEEAVRSSSPCSDGGDPGSDSDEEQQSHPLLVVPQTSSIEMSLWSLDASATSSMDTSLTAETEVCAGREAGFFSTFLLLNYFSFQTWQVFLSGRHAVALCWLATSIGTCRWNATMLARTTQPV